MQTQLAPEFAATPEGLAAEAILRNIQQQHHPLLRALELEVLKRQFATQQSVLAHVQNHVLVDVDQFHGIEFSEFPARIAETAMWMMDHIMNTQASLEFGAAFLGSFAGECEILL